MKQKRSSLYYTLCVLAGGIFWGFSGTCGQYLFSRQGIQSGWLTSVRMLSSGVILVVLAFFTARRRLTGLLHSRRSLLITLAFAVLGIGVSQYSYLTAIQYSNSGTATVLQYLGPVLIMLTVCAQQRRAPSLTEAAALFCALAGTFLLATHGRFGSLAISGKALFWGLLSALGLVFYTMIPALILPEFGSVTVTGVGMLMGGIPMALIMQPWRTPVSLDVSGWLALAAILLVGTVAAYTLFTHGVEGIGAEKASLIACIEPVAATLFSALWLHTAFGWADAAGFVLIIATVFLLTDWKALRRPAKAL